MKQFLNTTELAQRYGISKATVFNLVRAGKLPHGVHLGKSRRWDIKELEAFEKTLNEGILESEVII